MPSLISTRTPPPRDATKYVLTKTKSSCNKELVQIIDSNMKLLSGGADLTFDSGSILNQGRSTSASSILTPIGFDFNFDGITYTHFTANTNGWMILADPSAATVQEVHSHCFLSGTTRLYENQNIVTNITSSSTLLCPWFDNLSTITNDLSEAVSLGVISQNEKEKINTGLATPPQMFNESCWGIRYHSDHSHEGRWTVVRWNCQSDPNSISSGSVLRFETVLYENGKIEFRYPSKQSPKLNLVASSSLAGGAESATVGIFPPGNRRFRDFSRLLGSTVASSQSYDLGGDTWSTDSRDTTVEGDTTSFVTSLTPIQNWPGFRKQGAILTYIPPTLKRRVLPRKTIRKKDNSKTFKSIFNDQKTLTFLTNSSNQVVVYPTTLTRFFGGSDPDVISRQNLFVESKTISVTGSTSKTASENFINDDCCIKVNKIRQPFSDHDHYTDDCSLFFQSGSTIELNQPLKSKAQIKFNLPLNFSTKMLNQTSSLLYYNTKLKRWEVPTAAISDLTDPQQGHGIYQRKFFEDHKGFGPIGNTIASGSKLLGVSGSSTTLPSEYRGLTIENLRRSLSDTAGPEGSTGTDLIQSDFKKSVTVNSAYDPSQSQTFTLPINSPFILEKAIFEIPFECGDGWFEDRTKTFIPHTAPSVSETLLEPRTDFAGPALTVALFNNIHAGNNKSKRDLILTGVITHELDLSSSVVATSFPPLSNSYQIRPEGFLAYSSMPAGVVPVMNVNGKKQFTGSIALCAEATTTNGPVILIEKNMISSSTSTEDDCRAELLDFIRLQTIPLQETIQSQRSTNFDSKLSIAYPNTIGRGDSTLNVSGRSIFGKEFAIFQKEENKDFIDNPFYIPTGSVQSGQIQEAIDHSFNLEKEGWRARAMVPLVSHFRSPYLIYPEDRLTLGISKTRPSLYALTASSEGGIPNASPVSGTVNHDLKLTSGCIKVTLYGSYLKEGKEYTGPLGDSLTQNNIQHIIGDEPVLDQFELNYREEFSGSYTDSFVTGTLVYKSLNNNRTLKITQGNRGRVFSKLSARSAGYPKTNSHSFNLQPWFEKAGSVKINSFNDSQERYWDTLMPSVSDSFNADGVGVFSAAENLFGGVGSGSIPQTNYNTGYLMLDVGPVGLAIQQGISNLNWTKSFPFEPRYSRAARQQDLSKSFIADREITSISFGGISSISPRLIQNLYIGFGAAENYPNYQDRIFSINISDHYIDWVTNINVDQSPTNAITSSAPISDISKVLFGFGDRNRIGSGDDTILGTNHMPSWRDYEQLGGASQNSQPNKFVQGPIIRGWKYGVMNGSAEFSKAYFRRGRFGQFRDMLEQRLFGKFFQTANAKNASVTLGVVTVQFFDSTGNITNPENTTSSNLHHEASSSIPFIDGQFTNRNDLNTEILNTSLLTLNADNFGSVQLGEIGPAIGQLNNE